MAVSRFKREHNGVVYIGSEDRQRKVVGSITRGKKKWTLMGFPKINRTIGSYKHGDEVQITIWNVGGKTTERDRVRYAVNWDTVEIFFPPDIWHELVKEYYDHINAEGVA